MTLKQTAILFTGIAFFNIIVCLPILLSSSIRRLFQQLPTSNLVINYILGMGSFTILHLTVLITVVVATGGLEGTGVLWGLGLTTVSVGFLGWLIASFVFPYWDFWNPTEKKDEVDGRISLFIGLIWYFISTGVGLFLLTVVLIGLFFPG